MRNKEYPYEDVPHISDLKDMLQQKAMLMPDATAFIYPCESGEMRKTYGDLHDDVNAFGEWMYHKKIRDKHVAIIGENSYEWLIAYFAAVNGGNTAVAIDKSLPDEEIVALAKMADTDVVFVSDTYYEKVKKKATRKVYNLKEFDEILKEGRRLLKDGKNEFAKYEIDPEKTATILFTSGTSGVSKGVELTNKNIAFEIFCICPSNAEDAYKYALRATGRHTCGASFPSCLWTRGWYPYGHELRQAYIYQ